MLSLRVMSPYEIKNQFGDYSSKYFREYTRSIIYSQPPAMIELSFCLKDLVRVRRPLTRVRALVSQSLPCFALLVDRKFSSGPPSEAGGGQHC